MHFNTKYDIKYHDLFLLCASLGFKKNRSVPIEERGRELRTNYLNSSQRAAAYTILLNDQEIGRNIEEY